MEKFYGCLRELSLNCDLGSNEESIIRDVSIANIQDGENQFELLKGTRTPQKARELTIIVEMDKQNQLKISGNTAYTVSNQIANPAINSIQKSWNNPRLIQTTVKTPLPELGHLAIDKTAQYEEKLVKTVV